MTGTWGVDRSDASSVRPDAAVLEGIVRLADRSLVEASHGMDGARFRLLEPVRLFGTEIRTGRFCIYDPDPSALPAWNISSG